jgi:hypothetical protein
VQLSSEQIAQFDEQGYLFLPKVFADAEVRAVMREVPAILGQDRPEVVRMARRRARRSPSTPTTTCSGGSPATRG